jgi:hypothetical protein
LLLRFLLFDRGRRLSSAPTVDFRRRRAQKLSKSAVALAIEAHFDVSRPRLDSFEHGGRLDDRGPKERSVVEFLPLLCLLRGLSFAGPASMSDVACDDRISLYPAAPFRLATLLHAWTIAQEGRGSSLTRQTDWARSANPHNSHTSDPPNAPEGASEL